MNQLVIFVYEAPHGITLKRFIPNWKTHLQMWNYYTVYEVYRQVETWKLYERAACRLQSYAKFSNKYFF